MSYFILVAQAVRFLKCISQERFHKNRRKKMTFKDTFPQQLKMNRLENTFKQLYRQFPERNLELPHSSEYLSDILRLAAQRTGSSFPTALMENRLEEDLFFRSGFDTELYRHLRYLPANWHSHSFLEVVCVIEGNCINYIEEQELHMHKGDICIIAPETTHAISAFSDDCIMINIVLRISTFERVFFGVLSDNDVLSDFFNHTLYHSKTHPYLFFCTGGDQEVFDFIFYAYEEFLKNRQYKERFLNNIVGALFITLLRNHGSNVIVPEVDSQGHDENVVFILKYMQENYKTITLTQLADFFNYSERQIQRIIKNSTGASFSQNIQKLKMRKAARLLMNPDMPVSAIAEDLGYLDPGNFRHIFKKYYGMTPAEYREQK